MYTTYEVIKAIYIYQRWKKIATEKLQNDIYIYFFCNCYF